MKDLEGRFTKTRLIHLEMNRKKAANISAVFCKNAYCMMAHFSLIAFSRAGGRIQLHQF